MSINLHVSKLAMLGALLVVVCPLIKAQGVVTSSEWEKSRQSTLSEVRLNLLASSFLNSLSLEYERTMRRDFSMGITASAYLGEERYNEILFPTVGVMPYARWYFGGRLFTVARPSSGFFIEVNSSLAYTHDLRSVYYDIHIKFILPYIERNERESHGMSWGIGAGLGYKIGFRGNWSGEFGLRLGYNLVQASNRNLFYLYPALSLGYRF